MKDLYDKSKGIAKSAQVIPAQKLEAAFDAGEDILPYFDVAAARRPALEVRRVNVDFPSWTIEAMDREAARVGTTRQSIIKFWVAQRLDVTAH